MKRAYLGVFLLCVFAIASHAQTPTAEQPATTAGNVSRVTYFDILPGKNNEFTTFLRTNSKPILDEQIKQGLIISFGYFTKPSTDGPGDWDMRLVVTYKNYADALDSNPERGAKFNAIGLAHYGTAEARTKANDSMAGMRTVVSSYLVRGMTLNPMPK
jgi:hypothetical protein